MVHDVVSCCPGQGRPGAQSRVFRSFDECIIWVLWLLTQVRVSQHGIYKRILRSSENCWDGRIIKHKNGALGNGAHQNCLTPWQSDPCQGTNEQALTAFSALQFSSVTQLCLTLCDPMDCSMPGLPVHHLSIELTQTHDHRVGDAIQPSHPLSSLPLRTSNQDARSQTYNIKCRWIYGAVRTILKCWWECEPVPKLCTKCSLGISNFLEEISSLSHSVVFLYFFALITDEGFLISPRYSLELCIQMGISFLFSFAFSFSSFLSYL